MGVMALIMKPQLGLAIVNGFAAGVQEVAIALTDKPPPEVEPEEPVYADSNDAAALILDQVLTEIRNSRNKDDRYTITEEKEPPGSSEQEYKKLLEQERLLEKQAQYNGVDPVVRKRLNLNSKLPPYEVWSASVENFDKQFQTKFGSK